MGTSTSTHHAVSARAVRYLLHTWYLLHTYCMRTHILHIQHTYASINIPRSHRTSAMHLQSDSTSTSMLSSARVIVAARPRRATLLMVVAVMLLTLSADLVSARVVAARRTTVVVGRGVHAGGVRKATLRCAAPGRHQQI